MPCSGRSIDHPGAAQETRHLGRTAPSRSETMATITGTAGNDTLAGAGGNDTLWGEGGNDSLEGGIGNDFMNGGAGNDSFVFRAMGTANADTVDDFATGTDKLVFDGTAFTALGASGNFIAGDGRFYAAAGATSGHDADDRIIYNTSTGQLFYDADGVNGVAPQLVATLRV